MLLDQKDRKILTLLLEQKKWDNIDSLCKITNLSRSNLNYHLEHINSVLCKNNLNPIVLKNKKIIYLEQLKNFYENLVKNQENIFLNAEERVLIITVLLLFNKQITLSKISEILGVSVNSIFNDIQVLKNDSYIKQLKITFKIDKKGYAVSGSSLSLHKLLINTIIEISEIDRDKNILGFLINSLSFDDFDFLQKNQISNLTLYNEILDLIKGMYQTMSFKNLNGSTLALIVFIIFTRKFDFNLPNEDFEYYHEMRAKFKLNKWYLMSSNLIDTIKVKYDLKNYDIGHFEKLYIAQMISSNYSEAISFENIRTDALESTYLQFKNYFENKGYTICSTLNQKPFMKTWYYFEIIPFKNLFDGYKINKKAKLFRENPKILGYLFDFEKFVHQSNFNDMKNQEYKFWLLASVFLVGIKDFPNKKDSHVSREVVLITNLRSLQLNLWIHQVLSIYQHIENYKIISPIYFRQNKERLTTTNQQTFITSCESLNASNAIYIPNKK